MAINVRKPSDEDLSRLRECLVADEHHKLQDPDWWSKDEDALHVFFDENGNRVWVKVESVLRLHIQHDPDASKLASARIMKQGLAGLRIWAAQNSFRQILFQSTAEPLIKFCQRLGFRKTDSDYSVAI
jgi:hypothetical protein